jgi:hypothetical protein
MAIKSKLKVKKTDGTYAITHPETEVAQITDFPFTMRKNSTQYPLGNIVFCENLPNGLYLLCTKAGSTANSAPSGFLTATAGTIITDGTLQWQVISISASGIGVADVAPSNPITNDLWIDTSATIGADSTIMGTLKKWGTVMIGNTPRLIWQRVDIATKISQIIDFEAGVKAILYKVADNLGITWQLASNGYFSFGPYLGHFILQWGQSSDNANTETITFPLAFTKVFQALVATGSGRDENAAVGSLTNTTFIINTQGVGQGTCRWIALGLIN